MASKQAPAVADNVDPVYEWLDDGASYLLRLNLPGFKKEDFRVHVDGDGRLTVISHRKHDGKALRLHKTFQLPSTANLDTITGRFDSNVLTLTVPKLLLQQLLPAGPGAGAGAGASAAAAAAAAAAPPPPPQAKEEAGVADDKPDDQEDSAGKAGREAETEERRTEAGRTSLTARSKAEDEKSKAMPPPPPPSEKASGDHQQQDHQDDEKAWADHREQVAGEAARRIEAARARVAEAKANAERERKCEHWQERALEEGLRLAEAVSNNKEVIATAVAAFTLGVFVSSRLFFRN